MSIGNLMAGQEQTEPMAYLDPGVAGGLRGYGQFLKAGGRAVGPTLREQLEHQKAVLLAEAEKVDRAIKALDSAPGVEEVLNVLREAGIR